MKVTKKIVALAVVVLVATACSKENRHGVDSQVENNEKNETGTARESGKDGQSDSVTNEKNDNATTLQRENGDTDFVLAAADGGLLELRLGELAKQNGSSPEVKEFAQTMIVDHGKANGELKDLAKRANIHVPDRLSEKSQKGMMN